MTVLNIMAEADDCEVLQGFICPMCKTDLQSPVRLLAHFQEEHSEEQDLIKTFKDLFGKAKKKILKPSVILQSSQGNSTSSYPEFLHPPQEIGVTVSHNKTFETIRARRNERLYVPTNQLIIRLEKLLDHMPSDPLKKKVHEQNLVPWVDGTAVSRCPNCAGIFHLARRQHHCRTCGGIMCKDCSHFMSLRTARKILNKPVVEGSDLSTSDSHLRLCVHCVTLLETREKIRSNQSEKPIISQLYELLSDSKHQADKHYKLYVKMCNSLNAGESSYSLQDAQVLRVKLLRLAESIDTISGKIASLGRNDTKNPPSELTIVLQNAVRMAATSYLRGQLLNLPTLPTEDQLRRAQERRRLEITSRIEEEKMRQARLENISPTVSNTLHQKNVDSANTAVSRGQGWIPEKKKVNKSDDPLIEQINIIKNYIKEAKEAHKFDEVASLEANLYELNKEFWRKQQTQDDTIPGSRESSEAGSLGSLEDSQAQIESNHYLTH